MTDITPLEMQAICASTLFDGYSPLELVVLLDELGAQRRTFTGGQVLATEDDEVRHMAVVLSGNLHVHTNVTGERRHLLRIVGPGKVLGATLVTTRRTRYPADVTAYGPGACLTFSLERLRRLRKRGGAERLFDNLHAAVGEELLASWRKCAIMSCPNIAERVMLYLELCRRQSHSKTIVIGSSEEAFAEYLGVHRTALSRVLSKLQAEGKFTYRRNVFTLP